jgi:type II secretory pathway pseudopilin PulG
MMIVISIVGILMSITLFPYRYYMQWAYVERATDSISQEWVLAHRAIRAGLQFDPIAQNKHARLFMVFQTGSTTIESYLLSGSTLPDLATFTTGNNITKYKTLTLDDGVEILALTGSLYGSGGRVGYMISPPYGDGIFWNWSSSGSLSDARIIVGYPWADKTSGRAREVLLRTYLR